MYYVIHVGPGNETKTELMIRRRISEELYEEVFHPVRHMRKKIHGSWKDVYECLIPGYVFISTENIQPIYAELKNIPVFTNLLGKENLEEETCFYPLSKKEAYWLTRFMGQSKNNKDNNYIIEQSQVGFGENDSVVIISGPLAGMEGQIKKINLHKRIAEVEVQFMNQATLFYLGIEIVEKKLEKS